MSWLPGSANTAPFRLVWELRLHGSKTVGVWGALPEDDRRALYPLWRARHDQDDDATHEQEGGETP